MIRPAHVHDLEAVHQLLIDHIPGTHPTDAKWLIDRLQSPAAIILVDAGEETVAAAIVGQAVLDEAEIHDVAVQPGARLQGRAFRLVEAFEQQAATMGATQIFLEVRANNEPAKQLYTKAGFCAQHTRPRYYPDGEDALILRKDIQTKP